MTRGRSQAKPPSSSSSSSSPPPSATPEEAEEEPRSVERLREQAWRGGPRGPGAGGKGRSRREREQNTNRLVPGGHERKVAAKIRAGVAKQRRRPTGPRSRTSTRRRPAALLALGSSDRSGEAGGGQAEAEAAAAPQVLRRPCAAFSALWRSSQINIKAN